MVFLITGGAGFIGNALIEIILRKTDHKVVNLDKLTYSSKLFELQNFEKSTRYTFIKGDVCDASLVSSVFQQFRPNTIIHLAAESHVDRSIQNPEAFVHNNIVGTFNLLQIAMEFWEKLSLKEKDKFRFHHVSTDEVFGDLKKDSPTFSENSPFLPSSPYAASKASSDHLVNSFYRTYSFPTLVTNCTNNFGAFQNPEKLIPNVILRALNYKDITIYGNGSQIRDWLFVRDHAEALLTVAQRGVLGETYNISAENELPNLSVAKLLCEILDEMRPVRNDRFSKHSELIKFVRDRPGHDKRYGLNSTKIRSQLGWCPKTSFQNGLIETVGWYLKNQQRIVELIPTEVFTKRIG